MSKPIILTVDDDPVVLNAVERDLRARYGQDYRIISINLGRPALDYLEKVQQRGETAALFLIDQRMPQMTGVEFLTQARRIFPEARRVLLTAYADTEAAIACINQAALDYYLMKPWHPPEERLYPVLDDLLNDWRATAHQPFDGIRVAGAMWSPACHAVKEFLTRHQIPYQWMDVESDPQVRQSVQGEDGGELKIPTLFFPDGTTLVQPEPRQLADKIGLQTQPTLPFYDLVIVGGGPAGLAAAVYASSEGLRCVVIERHSPGGQAGSSPRIDNYLGFPNGISGSDLARRAMTQARRLGAEILSAQEVKQIILQDPYRIVELSDGTHISCHAVLLATGASYNMLEIPGAADLFSTGVYYGAAYTEAMYYKGKQVYILGSANSAGQAALYLSRFARGVSVLIRGEQPKAAKYLVDAMEQAETIDLLTHTDLVEVKGTGKLESLVLRDNRTGETREVPADALFVFIGVQPQSKLVDGLVVLDEKGYVITGPDLMQQGKRPRGWLPERDPYLMETYIPGIFAAGDVRSGTNHRVASAAGEGGIAVAMIRQYLKSL